MKVPFKVSARTARLIGRENISNEKAAIIELVKNSYDADADYCSVVLDPDEDKLFIIDNGVGMTTSTIQEHWMVIGTENKLHDFTSSRGRIQSGAKGIGRFALDRLGHKCTLLSKSKNGAGTKWEVNWNIFDEKSTKTIDNVTANLGDYKFSLKDGIDEILGEELTPKHKLDSGVIIAINGLRDIWDDDRIKSLYTNLESLIPPEEESFKIYLYDLTNPDKYGGVLPALCHDFDFKLEASVKAGIATVAIHRNEYLFDSFPNEFFIDKKKPYDLETFKQGSYTKTIDISALLPGFENINTLNNIGDFNLSLYFMKLTTDDTNKKKYFYKSFDKKRRSEWMKIFGGIKLFRDNFRVRPYGETDSGAWDWLQLGVRQAVSPAQVSRHKQYRARPQNIAGSVHISRLTNIEFDDKSSREGLQDSDEFKLFKNLITSLLKRLEDDRSYIASELHKLHLAKNKIKEVRYEAEQKSKQIVKKIQNDKSGKDYTVEEMLAVSVESQKDDIKLLREEQRLMRVLASIGLTVSSFAHELSSIDRQLVSRFDDIKKLFIPFAPVEKMSGVKEFLNPYVLLEENKKEDKKIKQWLNYTLESIRKDKRKRKNVNFSDYFKSYSKAWAFTLNERYVNLNIKHGDYYRSIIRAFEIDVDTIFNNLLMNSLDAFHRKKEPHIHDEKNIFISIVNHDHHIEIQYRDNGPGLSTDIINPDDIFAPLFTTKKDKYGADRGTGLGMWLVKNVADEYNAEVFLKKSSGFHIAINFPLRKDSRKDH